jgi:hypothetical protein
LRTGVIDAEEPVKLRQGHSRRSRLAFRLRHRRGGSRRR